jgi:hypothetical protein
MDQLDNIVDYTEHYHYLNQNIFHHLNTTHHTLFQHLSKSSFRYIKVADTF